MDTLIVVNNFIHDFAAALWLGGMLLIIILSGEVKREGASAPIRKFFLQTTKKFSQIIVVSTVVIFLSGVIRTFTYRYYAGPMDFAATRINALIIKHIILIILVALTFYIKQRLVQKWKS